MLKNYKFEDAKSKDLYISIESHYVKLSDAKQVHWDSLHSDKIDDSIYIEIGKAGEILSVITSGIKEAEQFAIDIFNLCQRIKN